MKYANGLMLLLIGILTAGIANPAGRNAAMRQAEEALSVSIYTAQSEVTLGEAMRWQLRLAVLDDLKIEAVEILPGNASVWAWVGAIEDLDVLEGNTILEISAAPLILGELTPSVEIHYRVGDQPFTQLIAGQENIQVIGLDSQVAASLVTAKELVRKNEQLSIELLVQNKSPFAIKLINIANASADLSGEPAGANKAIPPGQFLREHFSLEVAGSKPRPRVQIEYQWDDSLDKSHSELLVVNGEIIPFEKRFPDEWTGIIIGIVVGALASIIPRWIEEGRSHRRQKEIYRKYTTGLVRLLVLEAQHCADHGTPVDLETSAVLFKDENLYTILVENKLDEGLRKLWIAAENHNLGLNQPGGTERADKIRNVCQELGKKIELTATP